MKLKMYSVFDSKMEVFAPPFLSHNDATAMRDFGDMAQSQQFPYKNHPADYILFRIGSWDDHNGELMADGIKNLGLLPSEAIKEDAGKKPLAVS